MKTARGVFLLLTIFGGASHAAEPVNLDWLAGAWCADGDGYFSEEHWLPARGGLMLAVSRTVTKRGTAFEFLRIELDPNEGARYVAQPSGGPATVFAMTEAAPQSVTFANPQHDFPKRIRYTRDGDKLAARIDGGDDNNARSFVWRRCAPKESASGAHEPDLQALRRFTLATSDAHGLYAAFGFKPLARPATFMERYDPDVYVRASGA